MEFLTHMFMAVNEQNESYVLHQVESFEVDRRNEKFNCDMTFCENLCGNELAKFGKGNQNFT